jgi:hypothetical protein
MIVVYRYSLVSIDDYRWFTLTPRELSACPEKYLLLYIHDEESKKRRIYIVTESFIDP